jgi:cell division protein FtsB
VGRWLLVFSLPAILCVTVLVQTFRERQAVRAASRSAEAAVQQLQLENQRLREEIEALRHDPEVIERIAREELNMLRPDELVLSFPDKAEESDTAVKKTEADKILTQPANRHPSTGHHTEPRRDHD